MRRAHLIVGVLSLAAFIGTGVYLHLEMPALLERDMTLRFTHRANHIYLLMVGLLNLVVCVVWSLHPRPWKRTLQMTGSLALLASPVVLGVAFVLEADSTSEFRPITAIGVMIAFAGTMLYLFGFQRVKRSRWSV